MRVFLILSAFIGLSLQCGRGAKAEELGQSKIRQEFQELLLQPEKTQDFYTKYGMDGLSERAWWNLQHKNLEIESSDLISKFAQLRELISTKPYALGFLFQNLSGIFSEIIRRPFDALSESFIIFENLLIPGFLSLTFLFLLQLSLWMSPIRRDLFRIYGARKNILPSAILLCIFGICYFTQQILIFLFLLSLICICYSRNKKIYVGLGFVFAFLLSSQSFFKHFTNDLQTEAALEALQVGRNRIEYSPASLAQMEALDRAAWAYWNQSYARAFDLLKESSQDWRSANLEIVLLNNPQNYKESISKTEDLIRTGAAPDILIFNLSQLYLQTQDLVKAEEMRRKLSPENSQKLSERAAKANRLILPASHSPQLSRAFISSLRKTFSFIEFSPNRNWQNWINDLADVLIFFLPWIFLVLALSLRKKVSGLCQETGEATSNIDQFLSKLALQVQQKNEDLDPQSRHKFLQFQRFYLQRREQLIRRWSWFLPGAGWASEGKYLAGFFSSFLVYYLAWIASPLWLRQHIHQYLRFSEYQQVFELGLSISLLTLALAAYFLIRNLALRRAA